VMVSASMPERALRGLTGSYYPERSGGLSLPSWLAGKSATFGSESPPHRWQGCKLSSVGILLAQLVVDRCSSG